MSGMSNEEAFYRLRDGNDVISQQASDLRKQFRRKRTLG
jgi:hypothetical protein